MGEFADLLARVSVRAESPDGQIAGRVSGAPEVEIHFRAGAYPRFSERELGHQLGQLAAVLSSRYRREYDRVAELHRDGGPAPDEQAEDVIFRERRAALTVRGRSTRGWLEAESRALVRWQVTVAAGALRALTEPEFLAELDSAVIDVLRDWQHRVIVLAEEIYGIGVPGTLRTSTDS